MSTRPTLDELVTRATKLGADAGRAAASWVTDGNTTPATYRRILQGIEVFLSLGHDRQPLTDEWRSAGAYTGEGETPHVATIPQRSRARDRHAL